MQTNKVCALKKCPARYALKGTSVRFFRFPKERERCKEWATACGQGALLDRMLACGQMLYDSMYRVCSLHFDDKKYLSANAVPTLLLHTGLSELQSNVEHVSMEEDNTEEGYTTPPYMSTTSTSAEGHTPPTYMSTPSTSAEGHTSLPYMSTPLTSAEGDTPFPYTSTPSTSGDRGNITPSTSTALSHVYSSITQTGRVLTSHTPRKQIYRKKIKSLQDEVRALKRKLQTEQERKVCIVDNITDDTMTAIIDAQFPVPVATFIKQEYELFKEKKKDKGTV